MDLLTADVWGFYNLGKDLPQITSVVSLFTSDLLISICYCSNLIITVILFMLHLAVDSDPVRLSIHLLDL